MTRSKNFIKAFTLIELLVVISIISMISSVVLVSVQEAREKAEFARLLSHLNALRTFVLSYYYNNGVPMDFRTCPLGGTGCKICADNNNLPAGQVPNWPPADTIDAPFIDGMPGLAHRTGTKNGCMTLNYSGVYTFDAQFYIRGDDIDYYNRVLKDLFAQTTDLCEVYTFDPPVSDCAIQTMFGL